MQFQMTKENNTRLKRYMEHHKFENMNTALDDLLKKNSVKIDPLIQENVERMNRAKRYTKTERENI